MSIGMMRKTHFIVAALTTVGLAGATGETLATARISMRVTPNVSAAPSTVVVQTTIPRNPDNRSLLIEADSGEFYRASEIPLDGDRAPVITEVRLKGLPGGEYIVRAVLREGQ